VEQLEQRIEVIRDDMEMLDVEELKEHVRGAHMTPKSRLSIIYQNLSIAPNEAAPGYLDDFTVEITSTIMQALPYISRLNSLLEVWFVRLLVLRKVPIFLQQLEDTELAIESARSAIEEGRRPRVARGSDITRDAFTTMKLILQDRVIQLAQQLDAILDALEGQNDRIPDEWIDKMEAAQEDYENWVVQAERQVYENEWMARENHQSTKSLEGSFEDVTEADAKDHEAESIEVPEKVVEEMDLQACHTLPSSLVSEETPLIPPQDPVRLSRPIAMSDTLVLNDLISNRHTIDPSNTREASPNVGPAGFLLAPAAKEFGLLIGGGNKGDGTVVANEEQEGGSKSVITEDSKAAETSGLEPPMDAYSDAIVQLSVTDKKTVANNREPFIKYETANVESRPEGTRSPVHRPAPLDLSQLTISSLSSDTSAPHSATSGSYSEMSSPEILDAAKVQFFKTPTDEISPYWASKDSPSMVSRQSSQRTQTSIHTVRGKDSSTDLARNIRQRSRSSTLTGLTSTNSSSGISKHPISEDDWDIKRSYSQLKRASTTSIEVLPRSEVCISPLRGCHETKFILVA
jgi:hypothetical protein